ncbi:unnamed protein product [Adineta steineri]|uniref:BHLH domain-containing protein n=1 Tax=Adineta steineri TaxID=433720 RepID=A0A815LF53_9BILA|nr:unnamed protein product [Adineta steineri]CAF3883892.1 unnamed protein product [Adineta steineri]
MDNQAIYRNNLASASSSVNSSSKPDIVPPTKSRRGRKRVTDPILATQLKYHRRSRANDRERTRMRLLNESLEHLRTLLPVDSVSCYSSTDSSNHGTMLEDKLTKIETLRTASEYIRVLTSLLEDSNNSSTSSSYSYNISDQPPQQQPPQVYQHSSYFGYTPNYSYYHPYC